MSTDLPNKPSRICCNQSMYFEWGESDSQWERAYPTAWHCHKCGCSEPATREEIRAMMEYEDAVFNQQQAAYIAQIGGD